MNKRNNMSNTNNLPIYHNRYIFVDLDGTLLRGSSFKILWSNVNIFMKIQCCIVLLTQGRAAAKYYLATQMIKLQNRSKKDICQKQYIQNLNSKILSYILKQKSLGYKLILATGASDIVANDIHAALSSYIKHIDVDIHPKTSAGAIANTIADNNPNPSYRVFDHVIASSNTYNTISRNKLHKILEYIQCNNKNSNEIDRAQEENVERDINYAAQHATAKCETVEDIDLTFTYIGNSHQDIPIWNKSAHVIITNPNLLIKIMLPILKSRYKNKYEII